MSVSRFSWKSQLYVKNCYNESDEKTKNGLVADNGSQTYGRMDRWKGGRIYAPTKNYPFYVVMNAQYTTKVTLFLLEMTCTLQICTERIVKHKVYPNNTDQITEKPWRNYSFIGTGFGITSSSKSTRVSKSCKLPHFFTCYPQWLNTTTVYYCTANIAAKQVNRNSVTPNPRWFDS